jgi:hypothetical protein
MQRTKWTDRKFDHDLPAGWMMNVLERLHGTVFRINPMIAVLSDEQLSRRINEAWSIKEHVGHLIDLEELHHGRIDDFKARKETLRAADMSNKKTNEADHNSKDIVELVAKFKMLRTDFIVDLENLDEETQKFVSKHPRLQTKMKPVDMAYFTAEHDDHHLALIRDNLRCILK